MALWGRYHGSENAPEIGGWHADVHPHSRCVRCPHRLSGLLRAGQARVLRRLKQDAWSHDRRAVEHTALGGRGFEVQFSAAQEVLLALGDRAHGQLIRRGQANRLCCDFVYLQYVGIGGAAGQQAGQCEQEEGG